MNNDLVEKVNYIMDKFWNGGDEELKRKLNDNSKESKIKYFDKPQIWNIDTDIYNALSRLREKIKDFSHVKYIDIIKINKDNKNNNKLYIMEYENINITPAKNKIEVARSTVRQFCQMLKSFDVIDFEDFEANGFRVECFNLKETLENLNNISFSFINIGQKAAIDWIRNLGYSLFLSLLYYKNFNFQELNDDLRIIEKRKANKKTKIKFFDIKRDISEIKQMYDETYKKLIINNFKDLSLSEIIDDIYHSIISNDYISDRVNDEIFNRVLELNFINSVNAERSNFKKKIFYDRLEKKLIESEQDIYSDLINEENNYDKLEAKFNHLDACHIYEVKNIKRDKSETIHASHPSNGILMKKDYHRLFDSRLFTFNENGELICSKSNKDYLFKTFGLQKCRIRNEILNDEMKEYLKRRNI